MENTVWKIIYSHLQDNLIDVFTIAQHKGEVKDPYVVLKSGLKSKYMNYSSTQEVYDFLCYVKNRSELEEYVETVKNQVLNLKSKIMIKDMNSETPEFYDEEVKGYMKSFQMLVFKRII